MNTPHLRQRDSLAVAVIGAGLSGLICARTLLTHPRHRFTVKIFDKRRTPGGRMSTRLIDRYQFDHGAQYFTVRDPRFQRFVATWIKEGLVAGWDGNVCELKKGAVSPSEKKTRYVGIPGMNAIAQHLARSCQVVSGVRVAHVQKEGRRWQLGSDTGQELGNYDIVVVAVPAPQAVSLLDEAPPLAARAATVKMSGCWTVMLAVEHPLGLPFDGAFVHESALSWIARDSSKPSRGKTECWVLHGSPAWSDARLDATPDQATAWLIEAFRQVTACHVVNPVFTQAHYWRYALPTHLLEDSCLFDPSLAIGACGDWCAGPRVEGAFLSGLAVADRIIDVSEETLSS